jgi:ribonuclease P protein component
VDRNRVKRRLRHLSRDLIPELPSGSLLVVRALPPAATASYDQLRSDLERALRRVHDAEVAGVAGVAGVGR